MTQCPVFTSNGLTLLPIKPLIITCLMDFDQPSSFYFVALLYEHNLILLALKRVPIQPRYPC